MTSPALAWHRALNEAAQWYVELDDLPHDTARREAWQEWLRSEPLHSAAWEKINGIGQRFSSLSDQDSPVPLAMGLRQAAAPTRRRAMRALVGLMALGTGSWMAWRYPPAQDQMMAWRADYQTGIGEIRDMRLSDGSQIWLNTDSAADFSVTAHQRLLTLHQGEVMVETAHDSTKPFIVETRFGSMRALGTVFLVRKQAESTHLAVLEGAVEVSLNSTGARRVVEQGWQVDFTADRIGTDFALDHTQAAWRTGVLAVDNVRLDDFLAQLSRYRRGYLGVHPDVAGLRVMGSYPVRDTDTALTLLSEALPVRVQRSLPWWVTIEPR